MRCVHIARACRSQNLLLCVGRHGFAPNGLRRYYLNRSQPPLLPQMVAALLAHLDKERLERAVLTKTLRSKRKRTAERS